MTGPAGYRVLGEGAAARAFLDRVHIQCDVVGVHEEPLEIWVRGALPERPPGVRVERLPDPGREWTGLEADRAIQVLPDLVVRPPWVAPLDAPSGHPFAGVELVVPRGSAFGSGESLSTQAVLILLHREWTDPASFADVGTGSGILCLYAAQRGVSDVQGCDVDPDAVAAARELVPDAVFLDGGPEVLTPADCVVVNLRCDEWLAARSAVLPLWRRRLVVGGLHPDEEARGLEGLPEPTAVARAGDFAAFAFDQSDSPGDAR